MITVLSMLIIFPLLALYMSSSGLYAYKKLKAEMKAYKDSIKVPDATFLSLKNDLEYNIASFSDKVIIAHFYDKDSEYNDTVWSEIKRIQDEFQKKTKRVQILSFIMKEDSVAALQAILNTKADTSSWDLMLLKDMEINEFLSALKMDTSKAPYSLTLIDRSSIVANYYDSRQREEVNNLMKHATILLPAKEDRRKIKFKREKDVYQ